jgi:hypothetical protein
MKTMGWRVAAIQGKKQNCEVTLGWMDNKRAMLSSTEIIAFQ